MKNRISIVVIPAAVLTALLLTVPVPVLSFDLSKRSIPVDEIISGGPAKDGIPSLSDPRFVTAEEARHVEDKDFVLGVSLGGEAKAYPIKILSHHEAVNDRLAGRAILPTW